MIVARMKGGLGNQFFIYAAARAVAIRENRPLLLEVASGFLRDPYKRSFLLDQYRIKAKTTTGKYSLAFFLHSRFPKTAENFLNLLSDKKCVFLSELPPEEIISREGKPNATLLLDGYWQDARFFQPFATQIKQELTWKETGSLASTEIGRSIKSSTAVAVHGRLMRNYAGDGTRVSHDVSKTLPGSYYRAAIRRMTAEVENPHFFIFSDNPDGFIKQLDLEGLSFSVVERENGNLPGADLSLMSMCRHFIISNSTFSWWGAFLSDNPDKIVFTPPGSCWDNPRILPKEWNRLNIRHHER